MKPQGSKAGQQGSGNGLYFSSPLHRLFGGLKIVLHRQVTGPNVDTNQTLKFLVLLFSSHHKVQILLKTDPQSQIQMITQVFIMIVSVHAHFLGDSLGNFRFACPCADTLAQGVPSPFCTLYIYSLSHMLPFSFEPLPFPYQLRNSSSPSSFSTLTHPHHHDSLLGTKLGYKNPC